MSKIILLLPFGLGDHVHCHGLVREYCRRYDKVAIFCLPHNQPSVSFMFRDLDNLVIIPGDKSFAKRFINDNVGVGGSKDYDDAKVIGFDNFNRHSGEPFERQLYEMAGVDFDKKWANFIVNRDPTREKALLAKVAPAGEYVFLHEDRSRNYRINRRKIDSRYEIIEPSPTLTDNIFDYCALLEGAKEIHVIDSSFMFLIDCLPGSGANKRLVVHRYARPNDDWKLPVLKKDWKIITRGYPWWEKKYLAGRFWLQNIQKKIKHRFF